MNNDLGHVLVDIPPFEVSTLPGDVALDVFMDAVAVRAVNGIGVPQNFAYRFNWRGDRLMLRVQQEESSVPFVVWFAVRTRVTASGETRVEFQPMLGWQNENPATFAAVLTRLDTGMRAHLIDIAAAAWP